MFAFGLIDPATEIQKIDKKLDAGGAFLNRNNQYVRFGQNIATMAELAALPQDLSLIAPAGWGQDADPKQPDGYLKIRGKVLNPIFSREQSAVVCLDDQSLPEDPELGPLGHPNTVFFYYNRGKYSYVNWNGRRKERLRECKDAFQTGPRIIERAKDRNELLQEPALSEEPTIQCLIQEDKNAGICANSSKTSGQQRVVLAADDRASPALADRRRYYVIYFHGPVPFYQIQSILLSEKFYHDAKPEWAVNLAGGNRSGLSVRVGKTYVQYGNLDSDLPSLLTVRRAQ
jgi:hypothetical protein